VIHLVVNADDFGLTEGVNEGIADAFKNGIITATSLIATMPAFNHAVEIAKENPGLDIGVHLSLTVGEPCLKSSRLSPIVEEGEFIRSYVHVMKSIYANRVPMEDVKNEMSAQIRKVEETGLRVSHLDSHQHVHMVPRVLGLVLPLMQEHRIPFVRIPDGLVGMKPLLTAKGWGLLVLGLIGKVLRGRVVRAKLGTPDYFWGLSCSEAMSLHDLMHILRSSRPGINELMCHPGYNDSALACIYDTSSCREQELAALTHPKTLELVRQKGIRLTNYMTLSKHQGQSPQGPATIH
jgi:predicted glycoside hydrolase/deacetylase ChbG (UPF0249 family)